MDDRAKLGFNGSVVPIEPPEPAPPVVPDPPPPAVPSNTQPQRPLQAYPGPGFSPSGASKDGSKSYSPTSNTTPPVSGRSEGSSPNNGMDTKSTGQPGANAPEVKTGESAIKEEPKVQTQEAVIEVSDRGVSLLGTNIPREIVVQVAVTAILTTATVSLSTSVGGIISRFITDWRDKMASDSVNIDKNPLNKVKKIFTDPRPKIIIRKAKRGTDLVAIIERFEPDGTNFILQFIELDGNKITGLIEILKVQNPNYTKNLDIRIDEKLLSFFHPEEVALWRKYFKQHSKLFLGVS